MNEIDIKRQKDLIEAWYLACQDGRFELADRLWELFCKVLKSIKA